MKMDTLVSLEAALVTLMFLISQHKIWYLVNSHQRNSVNTSICMIGIMKNLPKVLR